jgi:enoyl ACP reductase
MLLKGKHLVVTGVLTRSSIATAVARLAMAEGATCTFTSPGRLVRLTKQAIRGLDPEADVIDLDVTQEAELAAAAEHVAEKCGRVDGLVHSIAFAPPSCFAPEFSQAPWEDVATALQVSSYSLAALTRSFAPLMPSGSAVVALDFDGSRAWPLYGWMGVAKAALASTAQYVAAEFGPKGIRVNLVSSGPLITLSSRGVVKDVNDYVRLANEFGDRAPLGWDVENAEPTARACVALLSDWFPATTSERVHVDGGFHARWAVITDQQREEYEREKRRDEQLAGR